MAIKNILCIEDDRFIGEMYVRSLRKAGYNVDWQVDGNEGLLAATKHTYDLILLDIMLPEKRGVEILDALRTDNKNLVPNSKIIIMTNFDQNEESKANMESRVEGYLIKAEITPRRLLEIIKSMEK